MFLNHEAFFSDFKKVSNLDKKLQIFNKLFKKNRIYLKAGGRNNQEVSIVIFFGLGIFSGFDFFSGFCIKPTLSEENRESL